MTTLSLLESLCMEFQCGELNLRAVCEGMLIDGGQDFSKVAADDIENAIHNAPSARWHEVGFGCSELLAFYLAGDTDWPKEHVLRATATVLLLAAAIESGYGDWEFEFDKALKFIIRIKDQVSLGLRIQILKKLFVNNNAR